MGPFNEGLVKRDLGNKRVEVFIVFIIESKVNMLTECLFQRLLEHHCVREEAFVPPVHQDVE